MSAFKMEGGKQYQQNVGSRRQVFNGTAKKTGYGKSALTKKNLKMNKHGRIVSIKKSRASRKNKHLGKFLRKRGSKTFGPVFAKGDKKMKGGNFFDTTKYFVCNETVDQRGYANGSTLSSYNHFLDLKEDYSEVKDYEEFVITDANKKKYKNVDQSQKQIDSYYTTAMFPNKNDNFPAVGSKCVEIKNEQLINKVFKFTPDPYD
jgi:hypothetical protein